VTHVTTTASLRENRPEASNGAFDQRYRIPGYMFGVQTDDRLGSVLDSLLAPFRTSVGDAGGDHVPIYSIREIEPGRLAISVDGRWLADRPGPAGVAEFLMREMNAADVWRHVEFLVVHAAAACLDGKGLVLPGGEGAGKTTLVAAAVRAGMDYLTDEAALFHPETGEVHPFPRPLCMETSSIDLMPDIWDRLSPEYRYPARTQYPIRFDDLGSGAIGRACRVRSVMALDYRRGAGTVLEEIGRAEAVAVLAQNALNFGSFGGRGLTILKKVVEGAKCYRLQVDHLDEAVDLLMRVVRGLSR
jgi:hypothetical protein